MDAFTALADRTRRSIVQMLGVRPRSAGDIASRFDVSAPAISQHLKVLRQARLIQVRPLAQQRIYRLNPQGLRRVHRWVARYQRFWTSRLDSLEAVLRKGAKTSQRPEPKPRKLAEELMHGKLRKNSKKLTRRAEIHRQKRRKR